MVMDFNLPKNWCVKVIVRGVGQETTVANRERIEYLDFKFNF